nr:restriction endonuclease [uncultured Oscillibacter sp.]
MLVSAISQDIKSVVLVSNRDFTHNAIKTAFDVADKSNINLQVFGRKELDKWFSTYKQPETFINNKNVHLMIKEFSRALAKRIAICPEEFIDIEWRELEQIIATVFSDFGYNVELTPSAKDGGKDVIVWYHGESYIIEIKHWNKGNRVGKRYIREFLNIVIRENRKLGLYLSTSGYTTNAFETMTYIDKIHFRYGDKSSMQLLLKMYERVNNGFYVPSNNLEQLIEDISYKAE